MFDYLIRRLLIGTFTLVLITFVVYGLIRAMPGDPLLVQMAEMDPSKKIDPADYERLKKTYGLDKHWTQGYFIWLGNTLKFNLDQSFSHKKPVGALMRERVGPTLLLSLTSLFLAYILSGPLGLYSVVRANRLDERVISTLLYVLYSLPSFVVALFLLYIFYQQLGWLPLRGIVSQEYDTLSFWGKVRDVGYHMVLPVTCYTYGSLAYYARFIRSNMQEVVRQDYIRTARAKGVHPLRVVVVHAFRNTMIPMVTQLGLTLPGLLSGSVILEQIFTWPGMGQLFFEAIFKRDYPVIMGLTLMFSVLTLAGQLMADVLYTLVDPRVSYT
jgi:peptide/nickel transport system permease protein